MHLPRPHLTIHTVHIILITGLTALLPIGCAKNMDSTDVRTSGMFAEFLVQSQGDGDVVVQASLRVGSSNSSTYAELDGEDRLIASLHAETKTMSKNSSAPNSPYRAVFSTSTGGILTIAFERGPLDDSAPDSRIMLPDSFSPKFVGMNDGDSMPRGQPVSVAWDNVSTGPISWQVRGSCVETRSGSLVDGRKSHHTRFGHRAERANVRFRGAKDTAPRSKLRYRDQSPARCQRGGRPRFSRRWYLPGDAILPTGASLDPRADRAQAVVHGWEHGHRRGCPRGGRHRTVMSRATRRPCALLAGSP